MLTAVQSVNWEGGATRAWDSIVTFVPKLLIFVVVLLVGWFIAKALSRLVAALLEKVDFNRVIERSGITRFFSPTFGPIELIARLVYYGILLLALQLALQPFGPNAISDIVNQIVAWLPRAIVAVLIVVISVAIANAVREVLAGVLGGLSYGRTLARIAAIFVIALGLIAALNQIGIATTVTMPVLIAVLATISGILIVGVGGGLIAPMRSRWEGWLTRMQQDTEVARRHYRSTTGFSEPGSQTAPGREL